MRANEANRERQARSLERSIASLESQLEGARSEEDIDAETVRARCCFGRVFPWCV